VVPAIVDGTIHVNKVMHNTMWVPGHFHFYLLVGFLPMVIGFSLHVFRGRVALNETVERLIFWLYAAAAVTFCFAFLLGGWASVPRRWAMHIEAWMPYDRLGTVAGAVILLAALALTLGLVRRLFVSTRPAVHPHEA
jgi:cytochrome c oxidase subunit 1